MIVPVGLPFLSTSKASTFLHIKDEKPYHYSAVYAGALHSTIIPFQMEPVGPSAGSGDVSGAMDVNGLIQMLAGQARQNMVAILDVSMPAPALTGIIPVALHFTHLHKTIQAAGLINRVSSL